MSGKLLQGCVGINLPVLPSYPVFTVAGHEVAAIPGGFGVIGNSQFTDCTPHWARFSSFGIGTTQVSEGQYREIIGKAGREGASENHPVTNVTYDDALSYLEKRSGGILRLPGEQEWEYAARGPAVNIRAMMEDQGVAVTPREIAAFIEGRFENLVFGVLKQIYNDPSDRIFQKLVDSGRPFFGWRVYATPSGRLSKEDVWYGRRGTTDVNWGPKNAFGLHNMSGNVWEWTKDLYSEEAYLTGGVNPAGPEIGKHRITRGGSWNTISVRFLSAGNRGLDPGDCYYGYSDLGFRVVAPKDFLK